MNDRYHEERHLISKAPNPFPPEDAKHVLFVALQIWDEYMSQIGRCSSQDYARLAQFPALCARQGVELPALPEDELA